VEKDMTDYLAISLIVIAVSPFVLYLIDFYERIRANKRAYPVFPSYTKWSERNPYVFDVVEDRGSAEKSSERNMAWSGCADKIDNQGIFGGLMQSLWVVEVRSEEQWYPQREAYDTREAARAAAKALQSFADTRVVRYVPERL
jgi:hypothetical protein